MMQESNRLTYEPVQSEPRSIEDWLFGDIEGENRRALESRFRQLQSRFSSAPTTTPDQNQFATRADLGAAFAEIKLQTVETRVPHANDLARVYVTVVKRGIVGSTPLAALLCLPQPNNEVLAEKLESITAFALGAALFIANKWGVDELGSLTTARAIGTALRHLATEEERDLLHSLPDFTLEPALLLPALVEQRLKAKQAGSIPQALKLLSELKDKLRFETKPKHAAGRGKGKIVVNRSSRKLVAAASSAVNLDELTPTKRVKRQKKPQSPLQTEPQEAKPADPTIAPNEPDTERVVTGDDDKPEIEAAPEPPPDTPQDTDEVDPRAPNIRSPSIRLTKPNLRYRRPARRAEPHEQGFDSDTKMRSGADQFFDKDEPDKKLRGPMRVIRPIGPKQAGGKDGLVSTSEPLWHGRTRTIAPNMIRREHYLPCAPDFVTLIEAKAIAAGLLAKLENDPSDVVALQVLLVLLLGRSRSEILAMDVHGSNQVADKWLRIDGRVAFSTQLVLPDKGILPADFEFLFPSPKSNLHLNLPSQIQKALNADGQPVAPLFLTSDDFEETLKAATAQIGRPITEAMLSRALPAHCAAMNLDKAISGWILAERPRDRPMMSYARFVETQVQLPHEALLKRLGLDVEIDLIEPTVAELGTALVPEPESLTALFEMLKRDLDQLKKVNPYNLIAIHNDLTLYVVTLLMLATGHRPVRDPFDRISSFDFEHGLCFIADKEIRGSSSARVVFLPMFAKYQLLAYLEHLDRLCVEGVLRFPHLAKRAAGALNGERTLFFFARAHEDFAVSPSSLLEEMKAVWSLQPNWPRHTLRALLAKNVEPEVLDAIMAQDGNGFGHQTADSGIPLSALKTAAEQINKALTDLDIKIARGLQAGQYWKLALPPLQPPITLEGRALRKTNRDIIDFQIRQAVDDALVKSGLFTQVSWRKIAPEVALVGRWDALIGQVAAGIEASTYLPNKMHAYQHLAACARQMADAAQVDLKVPSPPFSVATPPSLYTETTVISAQAIETWQSGFAQQLSGFDFSQASAPQLIGLALYSAITNGFLLNPDAVVALGQQLESGRLDYLIAPDQRLCLRLKVPILSGACNWVEGDQGSLIISFFPDPITLELIHKTCAAVTQAASVLENTDRATEGSQSTTRTQALRTTFDRIHDAIFPANQSPSSPPPSRIKSLIELCAVGYVPLEANGFAIPQGLRAALSGRNQTFGPDPIALAHICGIEPDCEAGKTSLSPKFETIEPQDAQEAAPPNWQRYVDSLQMLITLHATKQSDRQKKKVVVEELERLLAFPFDASHARLLIEWLHDLLTRYRRKYSTFRRYVSPILLLYLTEFDQIDLRALDGDDFVDHYENIIDQKRSPISQAYVANRLAQLHRFGVRKGHWRLAPLSEPLGDEIEDLQVTRARIVTHKALLQIQTALENLEGERASLGPTLAMMAGVIWRAGLRRAEAIRLRLRDVQVIWPADLKDRVANPDLAKPAQRGITNDGSQRTEIWLWVRETKEGGLKSASARRRIPLSALLSDAELRRFLTWYQRRCLTADGVNDNHLFVDPRNGGKLDEGEVGSAFSAAMNAVLPGGGWSMHALRHSAISATHVAIEGQAQLAQTLVGWDYARISEVRAAICGEQAGQALRYQALARFAGHAHAGTTWTRYLHLSDFILAEMRATTAPALSAAAIGGLFPVTKASQSLTFNLAGQPTFSMLEKLYGGNQIARLSQFKASAAVPTKPLSPASKAIARKDNAWDQIIGVFNLKSKMGHISAVEQIIGVPETVAQIWLQNAQKLSSITSRRGLPRIDPEHMIKAYSNLNKNSFDYQLIQGFAEQITDGSFENWKVARWADLMIAASTQGDHEVRFQDPDHLKVFVDLSKQLLPTFDLSFNLIRRDDSAHEVKQYLWRRAIGTGPQIEITLTPSQGGFAKSIAGTMEVEALTNDPSGDVVSVTTLMKAIAAVGFLLTNHQIGPISRPTVIQ
jgi:integrase